MGIYHTVVSVAQKQGCIPTHKEERSNLFADSLLSTRMMLVQVVQLGPDSLSVALRLLSRTPFLIVRPAS